MHVRWCVQLVTSDVAEVAPPSRVPSTRPNAPVCHVKIRSHLTCLLSSLISSRSDFIWKSHHLATMPKQFTRKRPAGDEYEADGGFVEDAPKSKKTKAAGNAKAATSKSSAKSQDSESQYWEVRKPNRADTNQ